ncbi:MAG: hypothetical protein IT287_00020 [Bdellovibrionaceae bacterium]|nr:hypothetical protein [Pseudobdellovibrionaceae bacterium]
MHNNFESQVFYKEEVDLSFADKNKDLLIIDRAVMPFVKDAIKNWKSIYAVDGGEYLKDWKSAAEQIQLLCQMWGLSAHRSSRILVCGGGSVGDFGGFFASILKRGVQLVHIPSTWLAAIDSAHGGKTALNVGGIKNQVGTFYPAQQVYIFKSLLLHQSPERAVDGFGECLKMILLDTSMALNAALSVPAATMDEFLWANLKTVVQKKYDIVFSDPYETKGARKLLNLGHTLGHVLETATHKSHGLCVLQGLVFSLRWSVEKSFLDQEQLNKILTFIKSKNVAIWQDSKDHVVLSEESLRNLLLADKKSFGSNELDFVFVKNEGQVFCQRVSVDELVIEAKRQGWVK